MNVHKNAKLTPRGRAVIVRRVVEEGQTSKAVATAFEVCERTVRKWVARFRAEGSQGLQDRSSGPHTLRRPSSASRPPPSAVSCSASGSTASRRSNRPSRHGATSASAPASSSTSTSRSSAASTARATASPATAPARATAVASAGSICTSALTTTPVSPSARSCPTRRRKAPPLSSRPPSPTTKASAPPSEAPISCCPSWWRVSTMRRRRCGLRSAGDCRSRCELSGGAAHRRRRALVAAGAAEADRAEP